MVDDSARALTTQDGRDLTYLEVGDPHGPLVIHNHGGPSSRFEARLLANSASMNRLRLICVDRPGMGQSSPQKARTYFERRVHMWQGLDDRLVPDPINKAVADRMPGAVWHPVEGAGHLVTVGSGDEVFAIAAEELGAP